MPFARLDDRAVIAVTGRDAKPYLQGLITNDIEKATPALYAALLTPQGKILFDFIVYRDGEGFLLDVTTGQAQALLKRLRMYKLRAAVDLAHRIDLAVFAAWGETAPDGPTDPRLPDLGRRWIDAVGKNHPSDEGLDAYHLHRVRLGVPDSADMAGGFLLDANGEELQAVDFRKGCFVGQEVTARMKHKARPRRRMMPVVITGPALPAGTRLTTSAGEEAGEVATGNGERAMASLRVDRVALGDVLTAGSTSLRVEPAAYELPVTKVAQNRPTLPPS